MNVDEINTLENKSKKVCLHYFKCEYIYSKDDALKELGIDEEILDHLIEDYVAQIIKATFELQEIIAIIEKSIQAKEEVDYTPLRDLAHKNLGVAKNLRIKNMCKVLYTLMTTQNVIHIKRMVAILEACAVRLNAKVAYTTLKVMKIRKTFSD